MRCFSRIAPLSIMCLFLYAFPSLGGELAQISWTPQELKQGEVLLVTVRCGSKTATVEGDFNGITVYFYRQGKRGFAGIAGVDLKTPPGTYPLRVLARDQEGISSEQVFQLPVMEGAFEVQRLTLPQEMVDLKGEALKRVLADNKKLMEIFKVIRPERLWHRPFLKPVEGEISSTFGLRRIINGQDRSPHNGVDIAAPEGAEVGACNDGIVVFAGELYLSGKTIIIDHGFGLYSMYFHLSEMRFKEGAEVRLGDCIGLVGSSGRVTGPHLHWGIRLLGARVDPHALLRAVPSEE